MVKEPILEMKHITKIYPGVIALDDVSLEFYRGEIHAIVGENGAGKSTFIKTITGAITATEGDIFFEKKYLTGGCPEAALDAGISAIYQEFNLFPYLSVAENIFFGRYLKKGAFIDYKEMNRCTKEILDQLGVRVDPSTQVKNLSVGYQQIVEIAKAISRNVKLLIMDEPSAPLTDNEIKHMFKIIQGIKERGVAVIYISHRLEEIFEICDKVSVFRDGKYITTKNTSETDIDDLVFTMVNRKMEEQFPPRNVIRKETVLEVKDLCTEAVYNISFELHKGEILGLAGLVGAGRTEVVRALYGADKKKRGDIYLNGRKVIINSPKDAVKMGIGLIPEDRKRQGVLLGMSLQKNITFANMRRIAKYGVINEREDQEVSEKYIRSLQIKTSGAKQIVKNLSGGNQQKVVLAKWLYTECDILIFDEPTRGIDIGAKQEIYQLMNRLVESEKAIIMITSEMPELLGMADRIVVMHEGKITGILDKGEATQERIMALSSNIMGNNVHGGDLI